MQTYIHTHTHVHTYIHTYMHTYTDTYIHTHVNTYAGVAEADPNNPGRFYAQFNVNEAGTHLLEVMFNGSQVF